MSFIKYFILILLFFNTFLKAQESSVCELLQNGSFENQDFSNWEAIDCEGAYPYQEVIDNTFTYTVAGFSDVVVLDGDFFAFNNFDGMGPCTIKMCQNITRPTNSVNLILEWNEILEWQMIYNANLPRIHSVDLQDPISDSVLVRLHEIIAPANSTNFGVYDSIGWTNYNYDITNFIEPTQTLKLCFNDYVPEVYTGPGAVYIDDISLTAICDTILTNNKVLLEDNFNIYPNPTSDVLFFNSDNTLKFNEYKIFSINGSLASKGIVQDKNSIDVSALQTGIYILMLDNNAGYRFIKN